MNIGHDTGQKDMMVQNVMPQAMEMEVLIANPEATQNEGFTNWVLNDAPYPLPEYMVADIIASWDNRTYRTTLESEIGDHHVNMTQALDQMIALCQADTIGEHTDSLVATWHRLPTKAGRYAEALTHVQRNEFTAAGELISTLDDDFKLSTDDEHEQQRMLDLIAFLQVIHNDGRSDGELTIAEQNALEGIIDGVFDRPANWAQNILCFHYGRCAAPPTGEGSSGHAPILDHKRSTATGNSSHVKVYPNPANQYVTLEHHGIGTVKNALWVISDAQGREIKNFPISSPDGQQLWDVRDVASGAYSVELRNASNSVGSATVVIKP